MTVQNLKLSSSVAMLSDIAEYQSGVGIPVVDQNIIDKMIAEGVTPPSDYIFVPNFDQDSVLLQQNADPTVGQTDRSYLDIIFQSVRALQAEVAKLRNTMRYGMYSYNDTRTAQSNVLGEYNEYLENEPLWAIEEADLSQIDDAYVDFLNPDTLVPAENLSCVGDRTIQIKPGGVTWTDPADRNGFKAATDAKEFLYLTVSETNVKITLDHYTDGTQPYEILVGDLGIVPSMSKKYNIMVSVSRATKLEGDDRFYGKNFVWMTVADYGYSNIVKQGYWNPTTGKLQDDLYEFGSEETAEQNRMYIKTVVFKGLNLYKFNAYSKYQDFSEQVTPSTPSDDQYKYEVAHITIRSVQSEDVLQGISKQLQKNELIYCEANNGIYIITDKNGKYKKLNTNSKEETGMTKEEIISWLKDNGIHVTEEGGEQVVIDDLRIGNVTFINQETQKMFNFECTPYGELKGTEIGGVTLSSRISSFYDNDGNEFIKSGLRGFVGNMRLNESGTSPAVASQKLDCRLNSDRVKIAAIYAPNSDRKNKSYGCSHAFVELENTSDADFQLDGCYLFYGTQLSSSVPAERNPYFRKLALKGTIPAGGTYLIRGKQYTDGSQSNCMINVGTFDQEWFVENEYQEGGKTVKKIELVDFELRDMNTWMLGYGGKTGDQITMDTTASTARPSGGDYDSKSPIYAKFFIDSVSIGGDIVNAQNSKTWTSYSASNTSFKAQTFDCIYKNTFELDPAIQAYQALCVYDSKRIRNSKAQDYQYLGLGKSIIEFPRSDETYDISKYTPKASFERKNVSTDKTQLDPDRPNAVGCSFGIDMRKTRCFNWVSPGVFDEFVWIRKKTQGGTEAWSRFESYTESAATRDDARNGMTRKTFITTTADGSVLDNSVLKSVYSRIIRNFPGCNTKYTAHKCVVDIVAEYVTTPTTYEYVVGRAAKDMSPDPAHVSDTLEFTLYPTNYLPKVYQITDQQGFHWIEYQVWAAAAKALNEKINSDMATEHIIPVLVNTGDMTQNGTRANEWLDYYNGGKCLFNHLEQMNVVGNNDLCGSDDEEKLGTGDDAGKSNGFYFHVFYCYEIEYGSGQTVPYPIINGKYVPSLYYFKAAGNKTAEGGSMPDFVFVMVNSELTIDTCNTWYGLSCDDGRIVNAYTGWQMLKDTTDSETNLKFHSMPNFTPMYQVLYSIFEKYSAANIIAACHEMPFTVITNSNIANNIESGVLNVTRSIDSSSGALVGSHLNTLGSLDVKSNQWFGRLLEHFGVRLCIGGHKHTYACTRPVREMYRYQQDGVIKTSVYDGKMTMPAILSDDTAEFRVIPISQISSNYVVSTESTAFTVNGSKFPIMRPIADTPHTQISSGIHVATNIIYPFYALSSDGPDNGITYFMLQATGYKLTSNKELPSPNQAFSFIIPQCDGSTASIEQQYPMYAEISLDGSAFAITLCRLHGILWENAANTKHAFDQQQYFNKSGIGVTTKYLAAGGLYGTWVSDKTSVLTRNFHN